MITNNYCAKGVLEQSLTDAQQIIYTDGCYDKIISAISSYTIVIIMLVLVLVVGPLLQEVCIAFIIYDVNAERQAFEMWIRERQALVMSGRESGPQPVDPLLNRGPGWNIAPSSHVAPVRTGESAFL